VCRLELGFFDVGVYGGFHSLLRFCRFGLGVFPIRRSRILGEKDACVIIASSEQQKDAVLCIKMWCC
jgi:hypothetical protein